MSKSTNGGIIMVANVGALHRRSVSAVLFIAILFIVTISNNPTGVTGLPLDQFYPYNLSTDNKTEFKDDGGSPVINLDVAFPFFDNTGYFQIYVNNNGIISFLEKLETYKPLNFNSSKFNSNNNIALVAPYWSDIDIENIRTGNFNESVLFRVTSSEDILQRASSDVNEYFQTPDFIPEQIVIVTWYNVGFYGATGRGKNKRNTFQAVLMTNGSQSYVIFNYNQTVWTTGSNSQGNSSSGLGGEPAVVGFYSGTPSRFYLVSNSGTDAIINITKNGNTGVPGKFIFRVDGPTIEDLACRGSEFIQVQPENIPMLGRRPILVTGPCLVSGRPVRARFRELGLEFDCQINDTTSAICVTPPVFRIGEVTFEYDPDGTGNWRYPTILYVDLLTELSSPQFLVRENIDEWQPGKMVTTSWSDADAPSDLVKSLDVVAYSYVNEIATFESIQSVQVEPGTNSRKFKLVSDFGSFSTLLTRLCWRKFLNTSPVCIWSDVFPVRWKSQNSPESEEWCQNWIFNEVNLDRLNDSDQSTCPCLLTIAENDSGKFKADPFCDNKRQSSNINCVNNVLAKKCVRQNLKSGTTRGETCCYNENNELMDIRDDPGAGTQQRYHYKAQGETIVPFFSYYESDLLPKLHCCQYSTRNCSDFVSFRNATTCRGYSPPSPAQAAGDPHIVTLDGKNYSFNGVGDFYLVKDVQSTFLIQVEATQAVDPKGQLQNATVFTKLAVRMPGVSDTVEIRKRDNSSEILVNKQPFTLTTSQFRNISLSTNDDGSYLIVLEPISVSVTVYVTPDLLNIITLIGEESLKGNLLGLLGNYNGNADDDFISRNGTVLPADSSMRVIHYDFGMTWEVPPSESIFAESFSTASDDVIRYEPVFIDELSISPEAEQICGDNIQCKFDITVTEKESIGRSMLEISNKFQSLKEQLEEKVIRCDYLDVPANGNRNVSGYSNGSTATFTCNPGYEMVQGSPVRVCQDNGQWSGTTVVCALPLEEPGDGTNLVLIISLSVCSGVAILIVIAATIYYARKRRKRKPDPVEDVPLQILNIPVFENPVFMENLVGLVGSGGFRIPRPNYVDPNIYQEYF